MKKMEKLVAVAVACSLLFVALVAVAHAERGSDIAPEYSGAEEGKGEGGKDVSKPTGNGAEQDRNDPDDDGHGPDRGDDTRDDEDWNNGCGNDADRIDDNEGLCGRPHDKPQIPVMPIVSRPPEPIVEDEFPTQRVCWRSEGNAVEFFHEADSYNEEMVLGEAWNYFCYDFAPGRYNVLAWNNITGHGPFAPRYLIVVEQALGYTIEVQNPFWGTLDYGMVTITRIRPAINGMAQY